jgi:hypothetical protein
MTTQHKQADCMALAGRRTQKEKPAFKPAQQHDRGLRPWLGALQSHLCRSEGDWAPMHTPWSTDHIHTWHTIKQHNQTMKVEATLAAGQSALDVSPARRGTHMQELGFGHLARQLSTSTAHAHERLKRPPA